MCCVNEMKLIAIVTSKNTCCTARLADIVPSPIRIAPSITMSPWAARPLVPATFCNLVGVLHANWEDVCGLLAALRNYAWIVGNAEITRESAAWPTLFEPQKANAIPLTQPQPQFCGSRIGTCLSIENR